MAKISIRSNVSNVSNAHLFILLLFIIFVAIVIGVSFKKTKQIERFSNDSSKVTIEYFYTDICTKCVQFQDELSQLKDDLKDYINSGKIKFTEYDATQSEHTYLIRNERKVRKVPTLFIYESSKKPQQYTGELSAKSIKDYIDQTHGKILDFAEFDVSPIIAPERPVPRPEIQPVPRPEIQPVPRPEIQPVPRPEIQPAPRPEIQPAPRPTPLPSPSNPPSNDCVKKAIQQNVDVYLRQQQNMKNKLNEMIRNIDNETENFKNGLNSDVEKCMV